MHTLDVGSIKGLVTFLNPASYVIARKYLKEINQFQHIFIDGWLLVFISRIIGIKSQRFSFDMTSIAPELFKYCIKEKKSIYIIGSDSESVAGFVDILKNNFLKLNIINFRNGYFENSSEKKKCFENILLTNPDYVIVGMGTPLQEQFLCDLKNYGYKGVGFTCGGFIHQTSDKLYYYPKWVDDYNLRMPYRILNEKDFKKKLKYYIQFPFVFISDFVKFKISG